MRRAAAWLALALAPAAVAAACADGAPDRATLSVSETLANGDTVGYARADTIRDIVFPADHGPHPDFKHEWWYFTGNLESDRGRRFGFQLTIFRSALRPTPSDLDSDWATRQAYMAHFALTDVDGGSFRSFERFDRGALGLAGARADPLRVWVGDWVVERDTGLSAQPGPARAPERSSAFLIRADEGDTGIALRLTPRKPAVLQGDRGRSRKGPEPGNASYYYSLTRLAADGRVMAGGDTLAVRGLAWLDREWGTSALGPDLEGWDWFALQLDDGTELMFYRLRRATGGASPFSRGSFVARDGDVTALGAGDVDLEPTAHWTSPLGGRYPSTWRLRVPTLELDLRVEPRLADQELVHAFRYWEGAVGVSGTRGGRPVTGTGYVELTGYAESAARPPG